MPPAYEKSSCEDCIDLFVSSVAEHARIFIPYAGRGTDLGLSGEWELQIQGGDVFGLQWDWNWLTPVRQQ